MKELTVKSIVLGLFLFFTSLAGAEKTKDAESASRADTSAFPQIVKLISEVRK